MKIIIKFAFAVTIISIIILSISVTNIIALPDAVINSFKESDIDFANAEKRINQVWKELPSDIRNKVKSEQIEWIKTNRDIEANNLIKQGYEVISAYTKVTNDRSDYLLRISGQTQKTTGLDSEYGEIATSDNDWCPESASNCYIQDGIFMGVTKGNDTNIIIKDNRDDEIYLVPYTDEFLDRVLSLQKNTNIRLYVAEFMAHNDESELVRVTMVVRILTSDIK
jgi:hypothetical protein